MLGSSVSESEKKIIYADLDRPIDDDSDHLPASQTRDFDGVPTLPQRRIAVVFLSPELLCADRGRSILATLVAQKRLQFIAIDEVHCFSLGTQVMCTDGRNRAIESLCIGDRVVGDDGLPKTVAATIDGRSLDAAGRFIHSPRQMYRIRLGDSKFDNTTHPDLVVTDDHVLCLQSWMRAQLVDDDRVAWLEITNGHDATRVTVQLRSTTAFGCNEAAHARAGLPRSRDEFITWKHAIDPYPLIAQVTAARFLQWPSTARTIGTGANWCMYTRAPTSLPTSTHYPAQLCQPLIYEPAQPHRRLIARLQHIWPDVTWSQLIAGVPTALPIVHKIAWSIGFWFADSVSDKAHDKLSHRLELLAHEFCSHSGDASSVSTAAVIPNTWFHRLLDEFDLIDNKHWPIEILSDPDVHVRKALLAGFIDGADSNNSTSHAYQIGVPLAHRQLLDGVIHLGRSLGYACGSVSPHVHVDQFGNQHPGVRTTISGVPDDDLPTVLKSKRVATGAIDARSTFGSTIVVSIEGTPTRDYACVTLAESPRFLTASGLVIHNCMSSWGHQFRPSFLKLSYLKTTYPSVPLMLLTATATKHVQTDVLKSLHLEKANVDFIRQSFNRPNIRYSVHMKETVKTMEGEDMTIYLHMKKFIDTCSSLVPTTAATTAGNGHSSSPSIAPVAAAHRPSSSSATGSSAAAAAHRLFSTAAATSTPATPAVSSTTAVKPVVGCSGIIYCGTRDACDEVAGQLKKLKGELVASQQADFQLRDGLHSWR
jgi:hypothetical protein